MPAAAVIPAPIAYIKVVAVKKLVVGFLAVTAWSVRLPSGGCGRVPVQFGHPAGESLFPLLGLGAGSGSFTLRKLECSKQALPL